LIGTFITKYNRYIRQCMRISIGVFHSSRTCCCRFTLHCEQIRPKRDIDQFLLFSILRIHLYKHHVILLFFCSTQSNYIHVVLYLHRYTIYIELNYYITSNIESTKTVSTLKEKTDICHFHLLLSCTLYYLLKIVSKSKCFQLIILLGIKPYC